MTLEMQEKYRIKLYYISITIFIIFMVLFCMVVYVMSNAKKEHILANDSLKQITSKYKLDSIQLHCMQKTMIVTYPRLSEYEARYYSIIYRDLSIKNKVDWCWFPAMMWTESRFSPTAHSEDDAYNLTQVIESTLKIQCNKLGIDYKKNTKWHDIHMIVAGIDYLCQGFIQGDEYAVKRYIGGPGYKKTSKKSDQEDIKKYWKSVSTEAKKIRYIYKGIFAEEYKMPKMQDLHAMFGNI